MAGAVFLDGHAFRTLGFHLRHYLPRLADPMRVMRFLFFRRRSTAPGGEADFQAPRPPREQIAAELGDMLARGLKLNFIFSGGASGYFNHVRQFGECYGRKIAQHPGVSVQLFRESDHTYILAEDRARLSVAHTALAAAAFPDRQAAAPGMTGIKSQAPGAGVPSGAAGQFRQISGAR